MWDLAPAVMELVRGEGLTGSDGVQCDLKVRRRLRELLIKKKKLTCTLAGVISLGTQLCANHKGSPRMEMG
jgi:hypothetical protein